MTETITVTRASRHGKNGEDLALRSSQLIAALIREPKATLAGLSTIAPLNASDISINEDGIIVIGNKAFADAYFTSPKTQNLMSNNNCNGMSNYWCS